MPRHKKIARSHADINALRQRIGYVSHSSLSKLPTIAHTEGLPEISDRNRVHRNRDELCKTSTPYGRVHQEIQVGHIQVEVQHPMSMLYHCARRSARPSALISHAIACRAPIAELPWTIILYADEITIGNQVAYAHNRKSWGFYWTFAEFDFAIACEDAVAFVFSACFNINLV